VVTKNIPNNALIVGNPGKIIGWVGETGERLEVKEKEAIDMILNVKYEIDIQNGSISSIKKIYD
jgi:UDP-2-acetamido-3-amino-2,3-dideoxy-glucuronate N-acetyltransferase